MSANPLSSVCADADRQKQVLEDEEELFGLALPCVALPPGDQAHQTPCGELY